MWRKIVKLNIQRIFFVHDSGRYLIKEFAMFQKFQFIWKFYIRKKLLD